MYVAEHGDVEQCSRKCTRAVEFLSIRNSQNVLKLYSKIVSQDFILLVGNSYLNISFKSGEASDFLYSSPSTAAPSRHFSVRHSA